MKRVEIEMLSETVNCPVVLIPGRKYPGVVVQGDSLKILLDLADDIEKSSAIGDAEELRENIVALKNKVGAYVQEYEATMKSHGKGLPYVNSPP